MSDTDPVVEQQPGATPEPSLDELLTAELDRLESKGDAETASEDAAESTGRAPGQADGQADGDGSQALSADDAVEVGVEDVADPPQKDSVTAPEHWSQADKDRFAKLPEDARQWWLDKSKDLERGYQDKFKEIAAIRKEADEIGAALRPVDSLLQQHGISRAEAVARLVGADQLLRQDFGSGLSTIVAGYGRQLAGTDQARIVVRQIAQQLGVDLGGAGEKPGDQAPIDPKIADLERRLQTWEQQLKAQEEQQRAQVISAAQAKLDAFREAKAEDGSSKHPHYEVVKTVMGALMTAAAEAGRGMTLEQAYEQAVWSQPDLRKTLTKAEQEAAAKAEAERRRQEVAKAKAAGTPQTKSAPTRAIEPSNGPDKDIGTLLEEGYERIAGAAR